MLSVNALRIMLCYKYPEACPSKRPEALIAKAYEKVYGEEVAKDYLAERLRTTRELVEALLSVLEEVYAA